MGNMPEFVFNLLALLKIGAVTITINTMLRERELEFILRDSDAVLLVANDKLGKNDYTKILGAFLHSVDFGETPDRGGYEGFPFLKYIVIYSPEGKTYPHTVALEQVREWGEKADDGKRAYIQKHQAYPDESCLIMYTSGTTAIPKGAVLTHDMLLRGAYASALSRGYQEGQRNNLAPGGASLIWRARRHPTGDPVSGSAALDVHLISPQTRASFSAIIPGDSHEP